MGIRPNDLILACVYAVLVDDTWWESALHRQTSEWIYPIEHDLLEEGVALPGGPVGARNEVRDVGHSRACLGSYKFSPA